MIRTTSTPVTPQSYAGLLKVRIMAIKKKEVFLKKKNRAIQLAIMRSRRHLYSAQAFVPLDWGGDVDSLKHVGSNATQTDQVLKLKAKQSVIYELQMPSSNLPGTANTDWVWAICLISARTDRPFVDLIQSIRSKIKAVFILSLTLSIYFGSSVYLYSQCAGNTQGGHESEGHLGSWWTLW